MIDFFLVTSIMQIHATNGRLLVLDDSWNDWQDLKMHDD